MAFCRRERRSKHSEVDLRSWAHVIYIVKLKGKYEKAWLDYSLKLLGIDYIIMFYMFRKGEEHNNNRSKLSYLAYIHTL